MKKKRKHKGYKNIRGLGNLPDAVDTANYYSRHERDALVPWILTPGVATVILQKPKVVFPDQDGNPSRYKGDLLVSFVVPVPRVIVEVKYQDDLDQDADMRARLKAVGAWVSLQGDHFFTQTDLVTYGPLWESQQHVSTFLNEPFHGFEDDAVSFVRTRIETTIGDIIALARDPLAALPAVWRAVARRRIFVDYRDVADSSMRVCARPLPVKSVNPFVPDSIAEAIDAWRARQTWRNLP